MKAKPFAKLRAELTLRSWRMEDLGDAIGIPGKSVSLRLRAVVPWSLPEAFKVCEVLEIPIEKLPEFFPVDGY